MPVIAILNTTTRPFYYYFNRMLEEVGVRVTGCGGGYYLFPDFEVCRPSLNAAGMFTGAEMCQAILEQESVSVRLIQYLFKLTQEIIIFSCLSSYSLDLNFLAIKQT